MRAAVYERTGPAVEVLRIIELPDPTPGPGEVRVRLQFSGVNPSDVKTRSGVRSKTLAFARIIPHSDGAGIIDEVGPGVARSRIGERVWTWNAAWQRPFGTAAQYVVLPEAGAVKLPDGIDMAAGACLGIPALTAYYATHVDGGVAGKRVLVAGGAGSVGHYAVQMAKLAGASEILSTVSGPKKAALAKSAGADVVLNYKTDDLAQRVLDATKGHGVDRIIEVDFGANITIDLQLIRTDGEIIVYGSDTPVIPVPFVSMIMKNIGLRFFIVYNLNVNARQEAIAALTSMLEKNELTHNVAVQLPLDRIAEAHDLIEQGRIIGNVVLNVGEP